MSHDNTEMEGRATARMMTDTEPITQDAFTAPPVSPAAAPAVPAVVVGQHVWYTPDTVHQFDKDHREQFVFAFYHAQDSSHPKVRYKKGERVANFGVLGMKNWRRGKNGLIKTGGGHLIQPGDPLAPWPAVVREIFADGTVALDIAHPISGSLVSGHAIFTGDVGLTLHYPKPGITAGLRYDAAGAPHTWRLLTDAAPKGA